MSAPMDTVEDRFAWVDWIIQERENKGMSQADLARAAGLTRTAISDYESRQRPNPDIGSLIKISKALGHNPLRLPRIARVIPPEPDIDEDDQDIIHELTDLTAQEKQEFLAYIRLQKNLRSKR